MANIALSKIINASRFSLFYMSKLEHLTVPTIRGFTINDNNDSLGKIINRKIEYINIITYGSYATNFTTNFCKISLFHVFFHSSLRDLVFDMIQPIPSIPSLGKGRFLHTGEGLAKIGLTLITDNSSQNKCLLAVSC